LGEAIRVVLVDDEDDERALLRTRLERVGGFEVVAEAADAEEGIYACADHRPDVVILDVAMPGMNGIDAVPALRKGSPATIVIIYTPDSGIATRNAAEKVGAHAVVGKLDSFDLLVGTIHRFLPDKVPVDETAKARGEFGQKMTSLLDTEPARPEGRWRRSGPGTRVGMIAVLVLVLLPVLVLLVWALAALADFGLSR
jgi:DNA-binding NarL/FixJ family response regulator